MEMKETWRPIPAGTGTSKMWRIKNHYEASSLGRIRNTKTGNIISATFHGGHYWKGEKAYETVCIDGGWGRINVRVSHLVWAAFTGEPVEGVRIYHIDGNPCNNAFYNLATNKHLKKLGLR